jgi:hypothetical protein
MDDDQITLEFGRVISVTASGSTRATTIQLAAVGSEGDDDGAERGDAVEVLQPAGLMAAPAVTATTEAPFIRLGDRQVALGLIDKGAAGRRGRRDARLRQRGEQRDGDAAHPRFGCRRDHVDQQRERRDHRTGDRRRDVPRRVASVPARQPVRHGGDDVHRC